MTYQSNMDDGNPFVHAKDGYHSFEIFGSTTFGYYYLDLFVGTPPQKQTVILDTGSEITAFPCSDCTDCGKHLENPFNIDNSSTY